MANGINRAARTAAKARAENRCGTARSRMRRRARHWQAGGVTMEYAILGVLVAAAVVVAVVVFSRSLATMFLAAGDGAALQHTQAKQDLDMRRGDRDADAQVAEDYHDEFHE